VIQRETGILILDTNTLWKLTSAEARAKLSRNMRVADLEATPTEVNLYEAVATGDSRKRELLLRTLADTAPNRPMLPWPFWLLKRIGQAVLDKEPGFKLDGTGYEWLLRSREEAASGQAAAFSFMQDLERRYSSLHAKARPHIQRYLKEHGLRERFASPIEFLDEYWNAGEMREHFGKSIWKALGLPGKPPLDVLLENEAWRIMLDAEGFAVYQGAFEFEQSRKVHRADLIQLVYLGAPGLRMLATDDAPFFQAAQTILTGRYGNARIVRSDELLE
jgi:hypothetical protein